MKYLFNIAMINYLLQIF